jgi:transforming growth factor-beta-induced protein
MQNLMDTIRDHTRLRTFSSALSDVELDELLSGLGPFTVFAPTNEAFARVLEDWKDRVLSDTGRLSTILRHHILLVRVDAQEMEVLEGTRSLRGDMVRFEAQEGTLRVNGIRIVERDIMCTNGILHLIDGLLLPSGETLPPEPVQRI